MGKEATQDQSCNPKRGNIQFPAYRLLAKRGRKEHTRTRQYRVRLSAGTGTALTPVTVKSFKHVQGVHK